jgi:putative ABC transport system substrate-binding protein
MGTKNSYAALGVSSVSPSALSHARQEAIIGLLSGNRFEEHELAAIRAGLAEFGLIEARNVAVEYRSTDGQYGRLPALAAELVRRPVAARRLTTPVERRCAAQTGARPERCFPGPSPMSGADRYANTVQDSFRGRLRCSRRAVSGL